MAKDDFRSDPEVAAYSPAKAATATGPTFKAGDRVVVDIGDTEGRLPIGAVFTVAAVGGDFVRLLDGPDRAWSRARFKPYEPDDLQAQPTAPEKPDAVFRPNHYARLWPEPITVINAWKLGFNLGNAVKYIARAGHKDSLEQDLKKAIRYLEIELECVRRNKAVAGGADKATLIETL